MRFFIENGKVPAEKDSKKYTEEVVAGRTAYARSVISEARIDSTSTSPPCSISLTSAAVSTALSLEEIWPDCACRTVGSSDRPGESDHGPGPRRDRPFADRWLHRSQHTGATIHLTTRPVRAMIARSYSGHAPSLDLHGSTALTPHDITLDVNNALRYTGPVIRSFADKDTEKLWNRTRVNQFQALERIARRKLEMVNAAVTLTDLTVPPGNRLEPYAAIDWDSTPSASTTNTASASDGPTAELTT